MISSLSSSLITIFHHIIYLIFIIISQCPFPMLSYPHEILSVKLNENVLIVNEDNNVTITCTASLSRQFESFISDDSFNNFTSRARLVITFSPREIRFHHINGEINCQHNECTSNVKLQANCLHQRIHINKPYDKIQFACQFIDDYYCSADWIHKHRASSQLCYDDSGQLTIISKTNFGERCFTDHSSGLDSCNINMICSHENNICICKDKHESKWDHQLNRTICVVRPPKSDSIESLPSTPTPIKDRTTTQRPMLNTAKPSSKLWILLVVILILLIVALTVIAIWSRLRRQTNGIAPANDS